MLLDLFCGGGGATRGYQQAGFTVTGVDLAPQPNYCGDAFLQGDALHVASLIGQDYDVIAASPPCQAYSLIAAGGRNRAATHVDLIALTRSLLRSLDKPYIIENVPQAPLVNPVFLCGTQFGLPIIRHRSFESNVELTTPEPCGYLATARNRHWDYVAYPYARKKWRPAWREHVMPVVWPWMTLLETGQAIPPAYTEFIGRQIMKVL
jgi:DNA (cytosine-5)-methyltransferase 1